MHASRHPKLRLDEDTESGIGSTLDLTSSSKGDGKHTNQPFGSPSFRAADRLPRENGTRWSSIGVSYFHLKEWQLVWFPLKRLIITAEAEPKAYRTRTCLKKKRHSRSVTMWPYCPAVVSGCTRVMVHGRWLCSLHVAQVITLTQNPECRE